VELRHLRHTDFAEACFIDGFLKGHDFTGCGKTQPKGLCNKGTALAGPIRSTEGVGLQPLPINLWLNLLRFWSFSAASSVVPKRTGEAKGF
jgi:hypothetical protein